jgi:anti-sigma factor ChrR (cupin superfamily)
MITLPNAFGLDPEELAGRPGYQPLRPGIDILYLYRDEETGASCAVLKYAPGAEVPPHEHRGYEHVFVLSGYQCDPRGRYDAGTLVINPPGTSHHVWSPEGCLVVIIWQRPIAFLQQPSKA